MYRYLIFIICFSSLLNASIPQQNKFITRTDIEKAVKEKPIAALHTLFTNSTHNHIQIIDNSAYQEQNQLLLLACLPEDLQTYTLQQNFFNDEHDALAMKECNGKPYVWALCLLTEYAQKSKPYLYLSSQYIFLRHPDEIAAIAEIEKQYLLSIAILPLVPPAPAPAIMRPWYKPNSQHANLTYKQVQSLKTVPDTIIEKSSQLKEKTIGYNDSIQEGLNPFKDTIKHCIADPHSVYSISVITFFLKVIFCSAQLSIPTNNIVALGSLGIDVFILGPLYQSRDAMRYWVFSRIFLDILGMKLIEAFKGPTMIYPFTIFPSLQLGAGLISLFILASRLRTSYPNRFIIKNKNAKTKITNRYCTLL